MPLFDPKKTRLGKPVKKSFMGADVYILTGLNALQGIRFHEELAALDDKAEDFKVRYDAAVVKHRVVNAKGEPLYSDTVDELAKNHDSKLISQLCTVVLSAMDAPHQVGDAVKN
ncbi:hypothetical protein SAMN03080615_01670 [Amphritea atlantica]|uniref:Uncharacterized protein n=2 Tax=Amphritea atlantica TaxID=355243 RepID=A0A1H9GGQ3_9GAMM|nr:hypothetical protein SAMN03080615_01670 [Amphritea atlantica]